MRPPREVGCAQGRLCVDKSWAQAGQAVHRALGPLSGSECRQAGPAEAVGCVQGRLCLGKDWAGPAWGVAHCAVQI